jgi:hypothetical protein
MLRDMTHFDLPSVRHELENLASARELTGFSEGEGLQYRQLCALERALIASS